MAERKGDWFSNLFQSEQARGLSGDQANVVALDDTNPYYNYRLRRHSAEGDLIKDPALLWFTSPQMKRRSGLGVHIAAERGDGTAGFTDVLVILAHDDYGRAMAPSKDPWMPKAMRTVLQNFEEFCKKESFKRRFPHRQLGLRILCDGSMDMAGQSLGLGKGEFVTGLLPNLYTGPVKGSNPVIALHVNLPGVWEGYREVGRLYNDQVLFTVGSHWLDNFTHGSLREGALYRLQMSPDGGFVHIVNPDLQDRYQVVTQDQGGASVLTLATRTEPPEALAYIVLEALDAPEEKPTVPAAGIGGKASGGKPGEKPKINLGAMAPAQPDIAPPMMMEDDIAAPMMLDDVVQNLISKPSDRKGDKGLGGRTVIPDAPTARIFTLSERGALLQKVHFGNFMDGYDVYLGQRGELGTAVDSKAATFQVRKKSVSIVSHVDGVVVGGQPVRPGVEVPIQGDTTIQVGSTKLDYLDLRGNTADGWPYVGEIRRPASSTYLNFGDTYQVGRSRDCRVVLPDEPKNENIVWKAGIGDGATIKARTGDIPKARFYTDSIMVASEHAGFSLSGDRPSLECMARHCYVYVRRGKNIVTLYPTESGKQPTKTDLTSGDEVLIGNCLFQVSWGRAEERAQAAPAAPRVEFGAETMNVAASAAKGAASPPPPSESKTSRPRSAASGALPQFDDEVAARPTNPQRGDEPKTVSPPAQDPASGGAPKPPPAPAAPPPASPEDAPVPLKRFENAPDAGAPMRFSSMNPDLMPGAGQATGRTVQLYDEDPAAPGKSDPWKLDESWDADGVQEAPAKKEEISFDDDSPTAITRTPVAPAPVAPAPVAMPPAAAPYPSLDEMDAPPMPRAMSLAAVESTRASDPPPAESVADADTARGPIVVNLEEAPPVAAPVVPAPPVVQAPPVVETPPIAEPPPIVEPPPLAEAPVIEVPPVVQAPPIEVPPVVETPPAVEAPPVVEAPAVVEAAPVVETAPVVEAPPVVEVPPVVEAPPVVDAPSAPVEPVRSPSMTSIPPAEPPVPVGERVVVAVADQEAQFELGRPLQVVQVGWTLNGRALCGNYEGADFVVPENRVVPDQAFTARDYFAIAIRGRRGSVELVSPTELLIDGDDPKASVYEEPEKLTIDIIRRDEQGYEDFAVRLIVREDRSLPDPRARFVEIDVTDPLAGALFTRGLPLRQPRTLTLGGITLTLLFDGESITLSDYLATYKRPEGGFRPFFVQRGEQRFQTAPEDGGAVKLMPGDRLVVGSSVFALKLV